MQINWPEVELVSTFHKLLTKPSNLEEVGSSVNLKKAGSMCPAEHLPYVPPKYDSHSYPGLLLLINKKTQSTSLANLHRTYSENKGK